MVCAAPFYDHVALRIQRGMGPRSFRDLTTKKPGPLVIILSGRSLPSMENMVMVHGMYLEFCKEGEMSGGVHPVRFPIRLLQF